MDKLLVAERINANANSAQKSVFPYDGIFSPHGFLSTVPCSSASEDRCEDPSEQVDGQFKEQDQGRLPPTKKPKKLTTSKNVTKATQNNDLPASHFAFGIDHILEQILYSLKASDLFKCRLVCRHWCIIATPELQKTVELTFNNDVLTMNRGWDRRPELRQLTLLLKQKSEITRSKFPCQKFKFNTHNFNKATGTIYLCGPQFTSFLNIYGTHIRSLSIVCIYLMDQKKALEEIRHLLTEQTLNLQNFAIYLSTSEFDKADLVVETESKDYQVCENKSLKTFCVNTSNLSHKNSSELLESVLQLAPNLEELTHRNRVYCDKYSIFMKPLNRIHLLKEVHLIPTPLSIECLEGIVKASLDTPGTLKLRRITIDCWTFELQDLELMHDKGPLLELLRKFVSVINFFLDSSWDTLEIIELNYVTFLKGIEWRKVMPKVKTLKLDFSRFVGSIDTIAGSHDVNILFSRGLGLPNIFPKLRSVEIDYDCVESDLVRWLNFFAPKENILLSVKDVLVTDTHGRRDPPIVSLAAEVLEMLQKFFPQAVIRYRG